MNGLWVSGRARGLDRILGAFRDGGAVQKQIPFGNDKRENTQRQEQTQIPFGNDKQEKGMTNEKTRNGKSKRRFPSGMTSKKRE